MVRSDTSSARRVARPDRRLRRMNWMISKRRSARRKAGSGVGMTRPDLIPPDAMLSGAGPLLTQAGRGAAAYVWSGAADTTSAERGDSPMAAFPSPPRSGAATAAAARARHRRSLDKVSDQTLKDIGLDRRGMRAAIRSDLGRHSCKAAPLAARRRRPCGRPAGRRSAAPAGHMLDRPARGARATAVASVTVSPPVTSRCAGRKTAILPGIRTGRNPIGQDTGPRRQAADSSSQRGAGPLPPEGGGKGGRPPSAAEREPSRLPEAGAPAGGVATQDCQAAGRFARKAAIPSLASASPDIGERAIVASITSASIRGPRLRASRLAAATAAGAVAK